jgi:hypothetical protein
LYRDNIQPRKPAGSPAEEMRVDGELSTGWKPVADKAAG